MVISGKSFDNGMICGSENNLVVDAAIRPAFIERLAAHGAAVLNAAEKERFLAQAFDAQGHLDRAMIGQSAQSIAGRTGITRTEPVRLIVVPAAPAELNGPLGGEKMAPFLSLFTVQGEAEGLSVCAQILENDGRGHTAAIHTHRQELIEQFGQTMPASRILANVSCTLGVIGVGTGLLPSLTLGCGTFGGNSTTDNVTYRHLLNIKRLALATEG